MFKRIFNGQKISFLFCLPWTWIYNTTNMHDTKIHTFSRTAGNNASDSCINNAHSIRFWQPLAVPAKFYKNKIKNLYIIFGVIALLTLLIGILNPYIFSLLCKAGSALENYPICTVDIPVRIFYGNAVSDQMSLILPGESRFVSFAWQ